nr:merozoite surface antigen 2 isoform X1 [Bactrocera oleae]
MLLKFLSLAYVLHLATAAPQLLTFKDGKFGVNFGGYHAEAGLGGLLTGNAAHGGLSASAGTPFGQRAGAGLGGSVDGDAAGVLYAGAEANPQTGAGAILGGDTSRGGYAGSQAFSGGRTVASTKNHIFPGAFSNQVDAVTSGPSDFKPAGNSAEYDGIQKVRPPKKYLIKPSSYSNNANKNPNNSDRKTTVNRHAPSTDILNHADEISTATSGNQNDDSDDGTAAASTAKEQHNYVMKSIAALVPVVQHPATAPSARGTTESEGKAESPQQLSDAPQRADGAEHAAAPPTIVVSRQRLRQKSRTRPNKRERHLQRQQERLLQTQQTTEASVSAVDTSPTTKTKYQQSVVAVQQHSQVS